MVLVGRPGYWIDTVCRGVTTANPMLEQLGFSEYGSERTMPMDLTVIRQDRGRDLPRFGPSAEVKTYSCLSDLLLIGWLTMMGGGYARD